MDHIGLLQFRSQPRKLLLPPPVYLNLCDGVVAGILQFFTEVSDVSEQDLPDLLSFGSALSFNGQIIVQLLKS